MALVFWKDSLDFNRIIVKQMDHESKGQGGSGSPEKARMSTYRKAAEDAINQHRAGQRSRSIFGSGGNSIVAPGRGG